MVVVIKVVPCVILGRRPKSIVTFAIVVVSLLFSGSNYVFRLKINAAVILSGINTRDNTIVFLSILKSFGPIVIGMTSAVAKYLYQDGGL